MTAVTLRATRPPVIPLKREMPPRRRGTGPTRAYRAAAGPEPVRDSREWDCDGRNGPDLCEPACGQGRPRQPGRMPPVTAPGWPVACRGSAAVAAGLLTRDQLRGSL